MILVIITFILGAINLAFFVYKTDTHPKWTSLLSLVVGVFCIATAIADLYINVLN